MRKLRLRKETRFIQVAQLVSGRAEILLRVPLHSEPHTLFCALVFKYQNKQKKNQGNGLFQRELKVKGRNFPRCGSLSNKQAWLALRIWGQQYSELRIGSCHSHPAHESSVAPCTEVVP